LFQRSAHISGFGDCEALPIKTLMWKPGGRVFETIGYTNLAGKLFIRSKPFPNTNNGYNGRQFHVSTIVVYNFAL